MKQTTDPGSRTDCAWNKLYNRLEEEGLLHTPAPRRMPLYRRYEAWAVVILACVVMAAAYWVERKGDSSPLLLTLSNGVEADVLVKTLEDGSVVFLDNESELAYPTHFSANERAVALRGNALFQVSGNPQRPFLIDTEQAQIEVLGTSFQVKNREGAPFELSVQHGTVKVTHKKGGETLLVQGGETVTLLPGSLHKRLTAESDPQNHYTQKMRFKDERLVDILQVVNQLHPDNPIRIAASAQEHRLTVRFSNNSPDEIAQLLCAVLNLTCTRQGNSYLLSTP